VLLVIVGACVSFVCVFLSVFVECVCGVRVCGMCVWWCVV